MRLSRRALVTVGVMGGSFLAAIEATVVTTAMPTVVAQFGGLAHYSWVFSAYMLTSTVTMPLWGKLSDLHGRRRYYMVSVVLFLVGSALCGAARSMEQLIAFRAIQGIGAGGMLPLAMTILGDIYTVTERARMQGLFSAVWGVASLLGPMAGGYVTEVWSWRWVFYLNLPFGVAAAALVGSFLVDPPRTVKHRIDYGGAALMMGAVAAFMVALSQTGASDATLSGGALSALYVAAAGLIGLFLWSERRSAEPIVPADLLTDRLTGSVILAGFLVGLAMFGALSFVPLFVQAVLGGSPTDAGKALSPLVLGWVGMSVVSGRLMPYVGCRPLVISGVALVAVGFAGLLSVEHDSGPAWLYLVLTLMGLGMGTAMLSLLLALQGAVPRERLGVATSVGQFTRSIGGAVGVSIMGAIVAAMLPPGGETDSLAMERALHAAFAAGFGVALLALLASLRIPPGHAPGRASHGRYEPRAES